MYAYLTCQSDIGYAITTLSKFSCAPGIYHYKLLSMVSKYLQVTAHWGIRFIRSKPLTLSLSEDDCKWGFFPTTSYDIPDDPTLKELFNVDINTNKLVGFVDATHANDLRKRQSTTRVVFTLWEMHLCTNPKHNLSLQVVIQKLSLLPHIGLQRLHVMFKCYWNN